MFQRLSIVFLLGLALSAVPTKAQPAEVDTTAVLMDVVERLRADGFGKDADHLLELIQRLYPSDDSTRSARNEPRLHTVLTDADDGTTELVVWSTFYGAALGALVPAALGAEAPEPYGAGILLGAPAGYGLSRYYASHNSVTTGQARAMTFGSWWGALQGLGWREVFDIGDHTEQYCYADSGGQYCYESGTVSDEAPYVALIVGGVTGLTAGTILGRSLPISGSTALITNFSAIWGSWFGTVLGVQLDQDESSNPDQNDDDTIVSTILISGNVGLLAGALGGPSLGWSTGNAWTVHMSGIAGLIGGIGIDLLASVEDENTGFLIPGLTSAAALVAAATLVGNKKDVATATGGPRLSLVNFASGAWSAGLPTPMPTLIPDISNGQKRYRPAAQVSLLRMNW